MMSGTGGHRHLDFYDQLTGSYSRFSFMKKVRELDIKKCLPISFVLGEINNLKLINDIFGYHKGDHVIKKIAVVFKENCHGKGLVARWSGNKFVAALPKTPDHLSFKTLKTIKKESKKINTVPMNINIILGAATKENAAQSILEILKKTETEVHRNKLLEAKTLRQETVASLVEQLGKKDYETEEHAWRMQTLAIQFGSELNLTDDQMEALSLTVTLHDIGKLAVPEEILMKPGSLTPGEWDIIKKHTEKGYRIALSSNELAPVAPYILAHHERWDGKGYPDGLKGKEIPLIARIVAIVDSYDAMTNERPYKKAMSKREALQELQRSAGSQFDPELVKGFLNLNL